MGRLATYEQEILSAFYGRLVEYRCNYCGQPIFADALVVIDPTGGYYPKVGNTPDFLPAQPRRTYHQKCDDIKHGRELKDVYYGAPPITAAQPPKSEQLIVNLLRQRPQKHYWTRGRIVGTLSRKHGIRRSLLRDAVARLLQERKLAKLRVFYHIRVNV